MSINVKKEPVDQPSENKYEIIVETIHIKNEIDSESEDSNSNTSQNEAIKSETKPTVTSENTVIDTKPVKTPGDLEKMYAPMIKSDLIPSKFKESVQFDSPVLIEEPDYSQYRTENNAYKCPTCNKLLHFKSHFGRHLEMHNRPIYECSYCPQKFKKQKNFLRHVDSHKDRNFKCEQCDNSYKTKAKLTQHKRLHDAHNPLKCKICGKQFVNNSCMTRHKQVCPQLTTCEHADKTKNILQCDNCKKKNKVKWVYCRFCKKRFDDLDTLKPHLKTHSGEKPFSCKVCARQFSTKSNMLRHSELHEKPKKLTCPICHKWFPLESKVIYHMGTHAKIQPFQCKLCPKKFSHKINATRHYQEKHPNEKFDTDVSYGSYAKAVVKQMQAFLTQNVAEDSIPNDENRTTIEELNKEAQNGKFEEIFVKVEPLDYEE